MSTSSHFSGEKHISFDDPALRARLERLRKKNDWAELVCDWYDAPGPKDYQSPDLTVRVKRRPDGLARFTFAVFDGCGIDGYWKSTGGRQLLAVLEEMGRCLVKPARASSGRAEFTVPDNASRFAFVLDYGSSRITVDPPVETAVEKAPAKKATAKKKAELKPFKPRRKPKDFYLQVKPGTSSFSAAERLGGGRFRIHEGRLDRPSSVKSHDIKGIPETRARADKLKAQGFATEKSARVATQVWEMIQKAEERAATKRG